MGLLTAISGTLVGFHFCLCHRALQHAWQEGDPLAGTFPTVTPPFALALSMILLFGRNGLITKKFLGITFVLGMNDIYGLDGLVIVQTITFFSVSYLILKAMLERLNPSMEEAAASLGASRFHVFRTVTLPLLTPGIAGSFLLLFVESLADLGNPLFIAGNKTVLSAQIFLAVIGEYDYQKASALALVLIIPTLILFMVQRYYVNRRSYISVTGKPSGAQITEKEPIIRWGFNITAYLIMCLCPLALCNHHLWFLQHCLGRGFHPNLATLVNDCDTRCGSHPGYHLPERPGHPVCGHPGYGHCLVGGAQEI